MAQWLRFQHQGKSGLGQVQGEQIAVYSGDLFQNPKPTGGGYQYLAINQVSYISILEGLIICYCILIGALVLQMAFAL
jgi:hypothetical protein